MNYIIILNIFIYYLNFAKCLHLPSNFNYNKFNIKKSINYQNNIIFNNIHFTEYYNDPRIHNMGNIGIGGWFHAEISPFVTKIIDIIRYNNNDIRKLLIKNYISFYKNEFGKNPKILDLCCGIGVSTESNQTGIDTSSQMIEKAKKIRNSKNYHLHKGKKLFTKFKIGNAENFGNNKEYDCTTIMFALHEMPHEAHIKVIENCFRITRNNIIFMDISPSYNPSEIMISGEPYLNDYLLNFDKLMEEYEFNNIEIIEDHVRLWYYTF
jgi:SAM-dependent methyltransferase